MQQKWKAMLHEAGAITENIVKMADAQQWRLQGVSVYVSVCRLSAVLVPMPCLAPPQPPAPTLLSLAKMRFWYLRWVFDTILSMTCSIHKAACLSSFVCCVILYV